MDNQFALKPRRLVCFGVLAVVWTLSRAAPAATPEGQPPTPPVRVYSQLLEPREYPDYDRRAVKPPGWGVFDHHTQFITLRGFEVTDHKIVNIGKTLDEYTRANDLGRVVWPSYPVLFATNLDALADELQRRNLFLFDIWGYVPGSGPGGYWQQFQPPTNALALLSAALGDHWLGTDIGEQDGRYVGGYAGQMSPTSATRFDQYLNFQRHFERMDDDLGHRHATLVSLSFGHYLLKEGTFTMIGAEAAQGLPNAQTYYSFVRGAGKQYGVPWFGNVSIYNRWDYKRFDGAHDAAGTSLSLMKRLLYSQILYNCMAVGFENGWFYPDGRLSPIGRIQQSAQRWVRECGPPGVQHTPVAVLLDFDAGWTVPRHLYSEELFRVWGNLPYEDRDYLVHGILDLLYPGYADSSYFHNETGFSTATPYGDIADCLLTDAPQWLLDRYGVVIMTGKARDRELRDKLQAYVAGGGHLVLVGEPWIAATGKGRVTVLPGNGLSAAVPPTVRAGEDVHLESPRPLSAAAREILDGVFKQQRLFAADPRLGLITCRRRNGEYTLGLLNNSWGELPLQITSFCGPIESIEERPLDTAERAVLGYTPAGLEHAALGQNGATTIAGGDIRIFLVKVGETGVAEAPRVAPPSRPRGCVLALHKPWSLKEEVLRRPTFFEHFDGVMVNWQYLHDRERSAITRESGWIHRQGLEVMVDASSAINLYPDLRLLDNVHADYEASLAALVDVLEKMELLGARQLLLSLHRLPENNYSGGWDGFAPALQRLAAEAAKRGITLSLRLAPDKSPDDPLALLTRVGAANLKLAPAAGALDAKTTAAVGLWLASSPAQLREWRSRTTLPIVLESAAAEEVGEFLGP